MTADFEEQYTQDPEYGSLFMYLLIKTNQLKEAERFLNQLNQLDSIQESEKSSLREQLDEALLLEEEKGNAKKLEVLKKLYAFSEYSIEEQLNLIGESVIIENKELSGVVNSLFGNPFVDEHIKALFLQRLIQSGYESSVTLNVLDQEVTVNPNTLEEFDQNPLIKTLNLELESALEKDPSLMMMIKPELNGHLLRLYPVIDTIIEDIKVWVDIYVDRYAFEESVKSAESNRPDEKIRMKKWIDAITFENT
ncbi:hypothetical protein [Marinilactibacillus sp. Marseille-P9653]|uniref:hypothetical protein n=1 Tax=Marinilactibacillus sp. Marseille-P9653 TaxID=2866583 RepID=UPI001CE468B5|nr:hypothetical protein [Marinilactibacillus sp. Marseille-P9653]